MSSELHDESAIPEGARRYQTSPLLGGIELLTADYRRHVFPPHAQDTVVLGLVERGRIQVASRGISMTVAEGDVLFIPAGVVHEAHSTSDDSWTYRAIYLSPLQWDDVCASAGPGDVGAAARVLSDGAVHALLGGLHARLSELRETEDVCRSQLGTIARLVKEEERVERDPPPAVAEKLDRVRGLLDHELGRRLSLSDMARQAGLSRFHFLRAFTRAFGVTPYAYAINRRVLNARRLLAQGRPISMAALEAGFADQAHLTRVFLKTMGVTPGEFRRAFLIPAQRSRPRHSMRRPSL